MSIVSTLMDPRKIAQLANMAGRGGLQQTGKLLKQLGDQSESQTQVRIGSCIGNGSSLNVTIGTNWTPAAILLFRASGSQIHIGHAAIGDGKSLYIRGNASVPQSMGVVGSLGIYLQSNGFSLGSTISVNAKSYGYIAFRSGPLNPTT